MADGIVSGNGDTDKSGKSDRRFRKKTGILGGSFDPVHRGHLNIAGCALSEFQLDEVWFIPAGHSPNKIEKDMTSAADRARMVELAIAENPAFRLSTVEMDSPGVSYTYRTLMRLTAENPDTQFYFIMGADSLDYFESWRHPEMIARMAVLLVAVRDTLDLKQIQGKIRYLRSLFHAEIFPVRGGKTDISSTEIRRDAALGIFEREMLSPKVAQYIREHGLYRKTEDS